jgi:TonB family protein
MRDRSEPPTSGWLGLTIAAATHAAALGALWFGLWSVEPNGGGGQYLEAISVTLVPSRVLEAPDKTSSEDSSGGAPADPSATEGDHPALERNPEQQTTEAEQPIEQRAPAPPTQQLEAIAAEQRPAQQKKVELSGGPTARGFGDSPSAATAGASPGEINRYAMAVRTALARSKPRGIRENGTVTITFAVSEHGAIRSARITEGSGQSSLDEEALAAVRRTALPPPPAGMNETQLTYVVPFHFK